MKKLFLFLVLFPLISHANDYQGIRYATTEGKVYEHLSGEFSLAASTATSSTYTITMNGDGGLITASSVTLTGTATATSFIGSGAALTGVLASPATFSYLVSPATFTVIGVNNSSHSFTAITSAVYSGISSSFTCIAGSTLTITTGADARVLVGASMSADSNTGATLRVGYLVDGGDVNGQSATAGRVEVTFAGSSVWLDTSFTDITPPLSAGAHTFCLKIRTSVSAAITTGSATAPAVFWVKEIR